MTGHRISLNYDGWLEWMLKREMFRNSDADAKKELATICQYTEKLLFQELYRKMRNTNQRINKHNIKAERFQNAVIDAVNRNWRDKFQKDVMSIQRTRKITVIPKEELFDLGVMHEKFFNQQKLGSKEKGYNPTTSKPRPVTANVDSISTAQVADSPYFAVVNAMTQSPKSVASGFPANLALERPMSP